jgi:hypothetical protein
MLAVCWQRFLCFFALLSVTLLLYGMQDAEQSSGKRTVISQSLSSYLRLTDQQSQISNCKTLRTNTPFALPVRNWLGLGIFSGL